MIWKDMSGRGRQSQMRVENIHTMCEWSRYLSKHKKICRARVMVSHVVPLEGRLGNKPRGHGQTYRLSTAQHMYRKAKAGHEAARRWTRTREAPLLRIIGNLTCLKRQSMTYPRPGSGPCRDIFRQHNIAHILSPILAPCVFPQHNTS